MKEAYYKNKETVQEYIKLAKDIDGRELIEKLKLVLTVNSSLLEIGSGPGSDWKILKESYDVIGSDYSAEFISHLNKNFLDGEFLEMNAITLNTEKKFDGIYANKVLHHLKDEELSASLLRQREILNSEGIVCHSYWKGEGSEYFKGLFVNYHSKASLMEFYQEYFEILSIEEYEEFEENDSLLVLARRKTP